MTTLTSYTQIPPETKVIVRLDLDLPRSGDTITDNSRLVKSLPTLVYLLQNRCHLLIIGHSGRPQGRDPDLSLRPIYLELISLVREQISTLTSVFVDQLDPTSIDQSIAQNQIVCLENLRFWPEEQLGDTSLFETITPSFRAFVNDAISNAHRPHASTLLHQHLPVFYGQNFLDEHSHLSGLLAPSARPATLIIGGSKKDKLAHLSVFTKNFDYLLLGGKLPLLLSEDDRQILSRSPDRFLVGQLAEHRFDLDQNSISRFTQIVARSKTIIWAGALGKTEDERYRLGSDSIARAIAQSTPSQTVVAGGDTLNTFVRLKLTSLISYTCSGGGVLLSFIGNHGHLPAWE